MKFNWGTGITIVILIFLGLCAWFIIYSRQIKVSFVEEDYYPKELRHEEKLVKMRNVAALISPVTLTQGKGDPVLTYPSDFRGKVLAGQVWIYRPSDDALDFTLPVAPDTALRQSLPLNRLKKGKYIVKIDWSSEGKGYYKELDLYIP